MNNKVNLEVNPKVVIAELVGTFALVFVGAGAAALKADTLTVALAFGFVLAAFYYAFSSISGAHFNPAVTLGAAINGSITWLDAIYYWVCQFIGAILAAALLSFIMGKTNNGLGATVLHTGVSSFKGLIVEAVLTFFLVTVVLYTTVAGKAGDFAGLAIGFTLAFGIMMAAPLTGGSLNPARSFGPAIFTGTFSQYWIYLIGPLAGAALAALLFKVLQKTPQEKNTQ